MSTFTYTGIVTGYLKIASDEKDDSGGSGLLSAYSEDGTYTVAGCVIGGKYSRSKDASSKKIRVVPPYQAGIIFGYASAEGQSTILCFGVVNSVYSSSINGIGAIVGS